MWKRSVILAAAVVLAPSAAVAADQTIDPDVVPRGADPAVAFHDPASNRLVDGTTSLALPEGTQSVRRVRGGFLAYAVRETPEGDEEHALVRVTETGQRTVARDESGPDTWRVETGRDPGLRFATIRYAAGAPVLQVRSTRTGEVLNQRRLGAATARVYAFHQGRVWFGTTAAARVWSPGAGVRTLRDQPMRAAEPSRGFYATRDAGCAHRIRPAGGASFASWCAPEGLVIGASPDGALLLTGEYDTGDEYGVARLVVRRKATGTPVRSWFGYFADDPAGIRWEGRRTVLIPATDPGGPETSTRGAALIRVFAGSTRVRRASPYQGRHVTNVWQPIRTP